MYIILYIYLFLAVLGLHCCAGFSLVVVSGSYSLVTTHRRLVMVASLVAGSRFAGLSSCSSWALKHRHAVYVAHNFSSKEQVPFNFMAAVTICSDFGPPKTVSHCFHCFSIYLP